MALYPTMNELKRDCVRWRAQRPCTSWLLHPSAVFQFELCAHSLQGSVLGYILFCLLSLSTSGSGPILVHCKRCMCWVYRVTQRLLQVHKKTVDLQMVVLRIVLLPVEGSQREAWTA